MNNDLLQYPFRSDVWGTFSDLTLVVVTTATLIYLIKTFRTQSKAIEIQQKTLDSQLQIQQLHLKSTIIENEKFRAENMPRFEVNLIYNKVDIFPMGYESKFVIEVTLTKCFSRNVWIQISSLNSGLGLDDTLDVIDYLEVGSKLKFSGSANISPDVFEGDGALLNIGIDFSDPVNNIYYQEFNIKIAQGMTRVTTIGHPILRTT